MSLATKNLCYMTKEVLNLEEASAFLGIAKSTLYKMTHLNQLPYFKPAGYTRGKPPK